MLWFWFTIGFIMTICGVMLAAYEDDVKICNLYFDAEPLGAGLITIGAVLAIIMLFALGINWMAIVEGSV